MGDLDKVVRNLSVQGIYTHYEKQSDSRATNSIGASIAGNECKRFIWYTFRHCVSEKFNGRILRLFETGQREEDRLIQNLRSIGCEVISNDESGKQFRVEALGGHLSGYLDGCVLNVPEAPKTWHVLECKTHNDRRFKKLVKDGLENAHPKHFYQCMIYMHLTGMQRALYIATNKNDDTLYSERIRYDKEKALAIVEVVRCIVESNEPPERIANSREHYLCKYCAANSICYGPESPTPTLPVPFKSCRQCCYATPMTDGTGARWKCEKHSRGLSLEDQQKSCNDHLILPSLLSTHKIVEGGKDESGNAYIQFTNDEYGSWKHGNAPGCISTDELMKLPIPLLSNEMLTKAKVVFDATVTHAPDDLLKDYLDSSLRWTGRLNLTEITNAWNSLYEDKFEDAISLRKLNTPTYSLAEYVGGRLITADLVEKKAEIREK